MMSYVDMSSTSIPSTIFNDGWMALSFFSNDSKNDWHLTEEIFFLIFDFDSGGMAECLLQ